MVLVVGVLVGAEDLVVEGVEGGAADHEELGGRDGDVDCGGGGLG